MMTTDQALLAAYRRGRAEAFRELVERHGGLVFGVAWRVTGDRMVAEEVVQDVFCLMARKSAALAGHPQVAGWLHRTAVNVARELRRRRRGYERKLARFAAEAADETSVQERPGEAAWEKVDEAINRLPADERAVVVLRYFEDLDHEAIAGRMGISETAARKRLSRGLARLQKSMVAPVGGLAVAAPASLLGSVAAGMPVAPPSAGIFTPLMLMTHKQLAAAAAILLTGGGLAWFGVTQHQEARRLATELAALRSAPSSPGRPMVPGTPTQPDPAGRAPETVASLKAELADEVTKRTKAENELATLRTQTEPLRDQVVVAYGKVNEIGDTLGSLYTEARALVEMEKAGTLDAPENAARVGKFMAKASSISGLSKEIIEFEDNPEEGSRFVAAAYGSVFGLNESEQVKVAEFFSSTLADAKAQEFTLSHLPEHGSAEFGPWLEKRWAFFNAQRDALRSTLPEAKRADFDQWVEKGGYGFKNLTMKGFPLMFSLGGDTR
ncbi:MAG: RNA polymerase sigma factor [Verrucomicrobiales bacterium]